MATATAALFIVFQNASSLYHITTNYVTQI